MEIKGTEHREKPTDYYQACRYCHKLFYFSRDCNGKTVICPHCVRGQALILLKISRYRAACRWKPVDGPYGSGAEEQAVLSAIRGERKENSIRTILFYGFLKNIVHSSIRSP